MACWYKRALQKKGLRIFKLGRDAVIEYIINKLCSLSNVEYGLIISNVMLFNPIDLAVSIIAVKIGCNKLLLGLIIAFLI